MGQTVVDVSHIVGWQGNLTGIERVEYHLTKHYYFNTDARYIVWDNARSHFKEVKRKFIKNKIIDRTSEREISSSNKESFLNRLTQAVNLSPEIKLENSRIIILAGLWDRQAYIDELKYLAELNDLVHVVYDMIPLTHKDYVAEFLPPVFENYMLSLLPLCDKVLAISRSTAKDTEEILKKAKLKAPRIESFRLGDDISRAKSSSRPSGVPDDFILTIGTIEARKNHRLLYELQGHLAATGQPEVPIVIAGKKGWLAEDFINDVTKDSRGIILLDQPPTDAQLRWLYENCLFTIFPSWYEGWGLPVAESLNYGKVTLSSNTSSMPEAGGKFADYFSPASIDELERLVLKYLDAKTRQAREMTIKNEHHPTSWDKAASTFEKLAG